MTKAFYLEFVLKPLSIINCQLSIIVLTLFLFSMSSEAQTPLNKLSSTYGGAAYEIEFHNDYIYAGCATTLMVYNIDPVSQKPDSLVYMERLGSNIDQIHIRNNEMYVCANHDGLYKYDITNPSAPVFLYKYAVLTLNESIYDFAFYGDTLVVAAKTKLNLLHDNGSSFNYVSTISSYTGNTRIRGVDIKNNLLAYTVGFSNPNTNDGVYLYDLSTMTQLDHYNTTTSDPLEVYFGQNTQMLHVMGGILSPSLYNGLYYVLDYSNTSNLINVYEDTVPGFILVGSVAQPMSCKIINDTVYVATQGGVERTVGAQVTGEVYVYDASTQGTVNWLVDVYAGLYHFDIDINEATRVMYVASEWYGILTNDLSDIYNENYLGLTLTGGWCHGSAFADNKLVEANEGYGMRVWDLSDKNDPKLLAEDTVVGFCRAVGISDQGAFTYGWYLTGQGLRVFDANDLTPLGTAVVNPVAKTDFKKSRIRGNRVAVIMESLFNPTQIVTANVTDPMNPTIENYRKKSNLLDIIFHNSGPLLALAKDSIIVFNPVNMTILSAITPPLGALQPFRAMTMSNDTVYVYYSGVGEGIARYVYDVFGQQLIYIDAGIYQMDVSNEGRAFMASDNDYLYIASTIDSLKALQKFPPFAEVAYYDHAADFIFDNLWGVHDLFVKDDCLFLSEYMGQTTMFGANVTTGLEQVNEVANFEVYPNPTTGELTVSFDNFQENIVVNVSDVAGRQVLSTNLGGGTNFNLDLNLSAGFYSMQVSDYGSVQILIVE